MKKITLKVTETASYERDIMVPDDWPDHWTGDQLKDVGLASELIEIWATEGDPVKDLVEVEETSVDWKV